MTLRAYLLSLPPVKFDLVLIEVDFYGSMLRKARIPSMAFACGLSWHGSESAICLTPPVLPQGDA